ncbi:TonB-dependent receptor [Henriciella mobilis]|nr:TonB-dependent receptor [Henriciella mobilis]
MGGHASGTSERSKYQHLVHPQDDITKPCMTRPGAAHSREEKMTKIQLNSTRVRTCLASGTLLCALLAPPVYAQSTEDGADQASKAPRSSAEKLMGTVTVTATKKVENQQDVPVAVTGIDEQQLEAIHFRDLSSLSFTIPNVSFDDNGQVKGFANFSIRGQGLNSSIPSLDPTVGLFVDGIYQGVSGGQVQDNFDIEAIEVLRGPQGIYFGRNVTGGAVLIRTKKPTDELRVHGRLAAETGLRTIADASVSGPIIKDRLNAKLAAYYSHDDGWHTNDFDNSEFGEDEQYIIRPALAFMPTDNVEFLLRMEVGHAEGDGPATQNHGLFDRDSFNFSIDEPGFYENEWASATLETNIDVSFGNGRITNILGWRTLESDAFLDVDSTPNTVFDSGTYLDQEQISNELRYVGTFGPVDVTTGLYYFSQDMFFLERRIFGGGANILDGGGDGTFSTLAAFVALDWHLNDTWTINIGGRYSQEDKEARVSTLRPGGGDYESRSGLNPDFEDEDTWESFSPRLGVQWEPDSDTQVYAYVAKGFRSGGYNFRNTVPGATPGPYDQEENTTYEIGLKKDFNEGKGRVNLAAFQNTIQDIQREVQVPLGDLGFVQQIQNVGEAQVIGFEGEVQYAVTSNLVLAANFGYLDSEYNSLNIDITRDGVIDEDDYGLLLPRLAPWIYGVNATLDIPVGAGLITGRLAYSHRDKSYHTDDNVGFYAPVDLLNGSIAFEPNSGSFRLTLYGKNLTNETTYGNNVVLPDSPAFGGDGIPGNAFPTFAPLGRGTVLGVELTVDY